MVKVLDRRIIKKPPQKHWVTYIKRRISQNKNFIGFISGQTGSGKSWSTLRICEDLDPEFSIDRVVFSGLELMQLINSGKVKRGSCIAFEEGGIEMNNRAWQSATNKMLNYLMQTFRHRGFILIMNSPYMDFVDAGTRKLFHAELQTLGIDQERGECKLKPHLIQYNGRMQKFYYKRLQVITPEGTAPIDIWRVGKPSKELRQAYEERKRSFTDELNQKIMQELLHAEEQRNKKYEKKLLTDVQEETLTLLKAGLSVKQIAEQRKRDVRVIRSGIQQLKKKGYEIKPVYEKGILIRHNIAEPPKNKDISDTVAMRSRGNVSLESNESQ